MKEYVQEDGTRSAHVFTSPNVPYVIVMCMDNGNVMEDHLCDDVDTAASIAEEWVSDHG